MTTVDESQPRLRKLILGTHRFNTTTEMSIGPVSSTVIPLGPSHHVCIHAL